MTGLDQDKIVYDGEMFGIEVKRTLYGGGYGVYFPSIKLHTGNSIRAMRAIKELEKEVLA